jgi:hypothetical protein
MESLWIENRKNAIGIEPIVPFLRTVPRAQRRENEGQGSQSSVAVALRGS